MADNREGILQGKTVWPDAGRLVLLVLCLLPAVQLSVVVFPYVTPKALFFWTGVAGCTSLVLWMLGTRSYVVSDARDPILWALVSFVAVSAVTAALGPSPHNSFFGDYERMWGVVQWAFLALFYVFLRTLFDAAAWRVFLRCTLYVAVGVALLAGLEFITESAVPVISTETVSTFGNPGYLGSYMVLGAGLACVVADRPRGRTKWGTLGVLLVLFASVIFISGNRSSLLGLMVGGGLALAVSMVVGSGEWLDDRRWLLGLLGGTATAMAVLWLIAPEATSNLPIVARLVEHGLGGETLMRRFETWGAALEGIRARPLAGWGMENFSLAYDRFVDPSTYRIAPVRVDRVHNVLLGKLVSTGPAGILTYLLIWVGLGGVTVRGLWKDRLGPVEAAGFLLAFTGYFVYLQMWFEDHSSAALLIVLAAYLRYRYTGCQLLCFGETRDRSTSRSVVWGGTCVALVAIVAWFGSRSALAAHRLFEGTAAYRLSAKVQRYEQAHRLDAPQHSTVAAQYATTMGRIGITGRTYLRKSDSLRAVYRKGVTGAEQALNRAASRNPRSGRLDAMRGRLTAGAGAVYGGEEIEQLARKTMRRAIEKSPPLLAYRHFLANIHQMFGDSIAAEQALYDALEVYDGFGRTYFLLSRLQHEAVGPVSLRRLRHAFWLDYRPEDRSHIRNVVNELMKRGRSDAAEQLLSVYFSSHYLPALRTVRDPFGTERRRFFESLEADLAVPGRRYRDYEIEPRDLTLLAMWPRVAVEAGQCRRATLAMRLLLNGLSPELETAKLRPIMARQTARLWRQCDSASASRQGSQAGRSTDTAGWIGDESIMSGSARPPSTHTLMPRTERR